ncbi:MAG: hypothetical protein AABM67_13555 [Acidobacteriota bacterium]
MPVQTSSAPILLTQENSTRAIAVNSVTLLKEPFQPQSAVKFNDDGRTRIMLFATNVTLLPGEDASSVTAQAEDGQHQFYNLPVEAVCDVPGFQFKTVVLKLDDRLIDVGDVLVGIKLHNQWSNRVRIGMGHIGGGPADDPVSTPTPTPPPAPTLVANPVSVQTGGVISVNLGGTWRPTGDYVGLYRSDALDSQYLNFQVAAASLTFPAPAVGSYNFRYLAREASSGNYYVAGTSNNVTVSSPQPTPTPVPPSLCKWYVATNGSSAGNGSLTSPWSIGTIAGGHPEFDGNAPPPAVIQPGDTICLRGGTYISTSNTVFFRTTLSGTLGNQITIRTYPGERAILDAQAPALGNTRNEILIIEGPYVTIRDLEVTDSLSERTAARPGGIQIAQGGTGVKLINNIIHDTGDGIDKNDPATDCEIYGNLIYNVGWDDRTNGLRQGGTGHGVYAANDSGYLRVYNNILATSFGFGFHFYSAGTGQFNGLDIQDNVSFNNGYWTRYHDSSYATEGRGTDNYLIGHRPVTGIIFNRNFGYHREQRGTQNLQLGYSGIENVSGTATNNVFIGGVNSIERFPTLVFTNNYISSFFENLQYIASNTPVSTTINNNTYYYYRSGCVIPQFGLTANDIMTTVTQWKALGFDTNSTINPCGVRSSTATITITANAYDANRFRVIVNNPQSVPTIWLNFSGVLANGDTFELRNSQDYFGPMVASGTYNGPISINMTTLNVAIPFGYGSLPNTTPLGQMTSGPQFGAFILIKK